MMMLSLVRLNAVIHVYDSNNRKFVRKNATHVARALREKRALSLRTMLARAEWVRVGRQPGHFRALRQDEREFQDKN